MSGLNGNIGALLVGSVVMYILYASDWKPWRSARPVVRTDIGSPSAEAELDPTRWSTNAGQPVTYIDGNRPHYADPAVLNVLSKVGGAVAQPEFEVSRVGGKVRYARPTQRFVNMDGEKVREPEAKLEAGNIDMDSWVNAG